MSCFKIFPQKEISIQYIPGHRWLIGLIGFVLFFVPFSRFIWDAPSQHLFIIFTAALIVLTTGITLFKLNQIVIPRLSSSLIGLLIFATLSTVLSPYQDLARNQIFSLISILIIFAILRQLNDKDKIIIEKILCISLSLFSALFIATLFDRPLSAELFINHNLIATAMIIGFFTALNMVQNSKILSWTTMGFTGTTFLMTGSAAGAFGIFSALIFTLIRQSNTNEMFIRRKVLIIGIGLSILIGTVSFLQNPWMSKSLSDRVRWWTTSFQMTLDNPVLGTGPGTYEFFESDYSKKGQHSIYAHNFPLQVASEWGIPMAVFLLFFMIHQIRKIKTPYLMIGVLAVFIQNFFDFSMNVTGLLLIFFILIALGSPAQPTINISCNQKGTWVVFLITAISSLSAACYWGLLPYLAFRHVLQAENYIQHKSFLSAENEMKEALHLDPKPAHYYFIQSNIIKNNPKRLNEAISYSQMAIQRHPHTDKYLSYYNHLKKMKPPNKGPTQK